MPGDPRSGSKVWEAPDREIGKPISARRIVKHLSSGLEDEEITR